MQYAEYTEVIFIVLIHPIKWTIALPVGATSPAKRQTWFQKKPQR